jgi:acyl-coenzyme A synthetase/AMP-(fatty) acid ligase/serine acetyltransferase
MYPHEYDGDKVKEWAGSSQWRALRADLARYKKSGYSGWGSEGFWALALYRTQRVENGLKPRLLWLPLHVALAIAKKLFTAVTHINLEASAEIGAGMLIPHVGPIRIHEGAKIGVDCAIHHVVTVGAGLRPGGARIGDHVLFGCHSCVLGPVRVGDCATIGSGSLVIGDVPAHATAIGVPARIMPGAWREKDKGTGDVTPVVAPPEPSLADARPALVEAPPNVPPPTKTAFEALMFHGEARGSAPALTAVLGEGRYRTWSFAQYASSARWACSSLDRYLSPQAPVLLFSRRTPECAALIMAAIGTRRPFSCLNSRWRWPQIRRVMEAASSRVLFVDREGASTLAASSTQAARAGVAIVRIDEMDFGEAAPGAQPQPAKTQAYPSPGRVGCTLFTSGSTGEPKGVCIAEQDLAWRAETEVHWYGLDQRDVLLNLLPFSFDVGLNQLMAAAYAGCETVLCESWMPGDVLAVSSDRKVTGIPCVPSIWQDFIVHGLSFQTRGAHSRLRFITISGGDLSKSHLEQIGLVAPGVSIFKTYGQTEAFRATSLRPESFADGNLSVGGPFPGVTVCVVLPDGTIAKRNVIGELVHAGLGVMMGYLGDQDRTREKLRPAPFDPTRMASFSGDNAFIDSADRVHLVGRSDQMVKIRGNRVYPGEVRNAICEVPGVLDAIVLAEKTADSNAQLVAFVLAKEGADTSELKREMRTYLPGYMVPKIVEVVPDLPRTSNGKPDAEALRPRAQELVQAEAGALSEGGIGRVATGELGIGVIAARIVALVKERVDGAYDADRQPLSEVIDSISFLDLVSTVDSEFRIGVDISKLGVQALRSPMLLAKAMLEARSPR